MSEQALEVKAFEQYAKERVWEVVRRAEGTISMSAENVRTLEHAYLAGVVWGREQERKAAKGAKR